MFRRIKFSTIREYTTYKYRLLFRGNLRKEMAARFTGITVFKIHLINYFANEIFYYPRGSSRDTAYHD